MHESLALLFQTDTSLRVKPRDKMNALLECQNTKEAVCALSPIEFYDLYHGVGANDALELLNYCSAEQIQTCFDLDIWRDDHIDDYVLTSWIEQLLTIEEDDQFKEIWNNIDPEVMALYLHRNVHIYMAENKDDEVEIPEGESPNVAQTPDFTFWIAYPEDNTRAEILHKLVDRLYAVLGIDKAWSYMETMHWELEAELEETGYHFRTERIREYGFMPRDEAYAIYAPCRLEAEAEAMRRESHTELYVRHFDMPSRVENALLEYPKERVEQTFFAHILDQVHNQASIKMALLLLTQRVATADGFQPHEDQGLRESLALALAYVNLGLEYVSMCDDDVAVRILQTQPLSKLFMIAHNVTLELRRKAKILTVRGHLSIIEDAHLSLLTDAQRDCVEGLLESRPRPAYSDMTPFASMKDVAHAAQVIADVALREVFFGEAAHKTKDDIAMFAYTHEIYGGVEGVNFDNVAATWLVNKRMKLDDPWRPIRLSEIPSREAVLQAVSPESILALYKSTLDETTSASQTRFAHQLTSNILSCWPENEKHPDPRLMTALVIENEEDV